MEAAAQTRILRLTELEAFMSLSPVWMGDTMLHISGVVFNYNTSHVSTPCLHISLPGSSGPLGAPRADVESALPKPLLHEAFHEESGQCRDHRRGRTNRLRPRLSHRLRADAGHRHARAPAFARGHGG